MQLSNQELIYRLKEGDRGVFELIFNSYFARLYHFAYGYITDKESAENIVQDTFVDFWIQRTKLKNDTNLNAWLYSVTKNKCVKFIERIKVEEKFKSFTKSQIKEMSFNQYALQQLDTSTMSFQEIERIITSTLEELPPQCRKIFEMSRFENKKYKEIAEELEISTKTVETQITKALKIFRKNLKDYLHLVSYLFIS
ncbi:RNA polymerase sigma-70 factor [Puteibacter caeruleilacunae]|nr:RNA polymerase sigma-70 factor [Puteibacter caeruleilacunae]